jgi:WhiB family transcriptional regulator, redox-sensing transcriptional regulator
MNHIRPEQVSDEASEDADLLELAVRNTPAWHADAACKEATHTTSWFSDSRKVTAEAVKVCGECLAQDDCRAWALDQGAWLRGVWGGLTESDRRKARRSGCSRGAAPEAWPLATTGEATGADSVAGGAGWDRGTETFAPVVPDQALFQ